MQTVSVRLFARFRERAGTEVVSVTLPVGVGVTVLRQELARRWPDLAELVTKAAIAVNEEYVAEDRVIGPGDDVALIPPVSGGMNRA
jgi:molybdopterin converting factor subunit 1